MIKTIFKKLLKFLRPHFHIISIITVIVLWSVISYFGIFYLKELFYKVKDVSFDDTPNINYVDTSDDEVCNVYGITLHGEIVTYDSRDSYNDQEKVMYDQTSADEVVWSVNEAEDNSDVRAILVEIDSGGGSPYAGEEIMTALKQAKKPVIAFIRDRGLSTAYLAATGADTIFASKFSDVGSVGVTMSYLQESEKNKKEGLEFIDLSSGKYKSLGSPDRAITSAEKDFLMRDINIMHSYFVELVSQNRSINIEKVKKLADGSSMTGEAALKNGLIDKIGLLPDAEKYISEKIGEKVNICW